MVPFLDLHAGYRELRDELDGAWRRVMDSGRYILGAELEAFEAEFARYCGVRQCVGVASGLDALALALRAAGIGPGDEVIVPAHTFIATWLAVSQTGATPVAVEPDPGTFVITAEAAAAAITPRTAAIVPVHLYGQTADMDALAALATRHHLFLLEDAAQAHGARCRGRRTGGLGSAGAFSFYPGKNLGAYGDGGAITCDDPALAERLRRLRNYGSSRKYHHEEPGVNSRLDEVQAALLRVRLGHLDAWNARRAAVAARYCAELAGWGERLILPAVAGWAEPVWHLFVVRHPERDRLAAGLDRAGVASLIHYPLPPYRQPAYAGPAVAPAAGTVSDQLAASVLSLPIGPHLEPSAVDAVIAAVTRCLEQDMDHTP